MNKIYLRKLLSKKSRMLPLALIALGMTSIQPSYGQSTLQILHTSDLEGGVEAVTDAPNFAAVVEALEDDATTKGIPSVLLSAGDNYIPGPFFSAANDFSLREPLRAAYDQLFGLPVGSLNNIREGAGRVDITVMNVLGFDAAAVGNHEFDAGANIFGDLIGTDIRGAGLGDVRWLGAQFPYLSSNLTFGSDGNLSGLFTSSLLENTEFRSEPSDLAAAGAAPKLAEATIIDRGGVKYGVVGATTPIVESITSTGDTMVKNPGAGTNNMTDLASIIQPVIDDLTAQGIDKIILVTHFATNCFRRAACSSFNRC